MTYRALELLNLPSDEPAFLLDIGCGSGLSGEILEEEGYIWAGVDIAPSMLGEYQNLAYRRGMIIIRGCTGEEYRWRPFLTRHRSGIWLPTRKLRWSNKARDWTSFSWFYLIL